MNIVAELNAVRDLLAADGHAKSLTPIVKKISTLQKERVKLLNTMGKKNQSIGEKISAEEDKLQKYLDSNRYDPTAAQDAVALLEKNKIATGEMNSRLVDLIEHLSKQSVYPPMWSYPTADWGVVSN